MTVKNLVNPITMKSLLPSKKPKMGGKFTIDKVNGKKSGASTLESD